MHQKGSKMTGLMLEDRLKDPEELKKKAERFRKILERPQYNPSQQTVEAVLSDNSFLKKIKKKLFPAAAAAFAGYISLFGVPYSKNVNVHEVRAEEVSDKVISEADKKLAEEYLIKGDTLRRNANQQKTPEKYNDAIKQLTSAVEIYRKIPDKIKLEGDYGASCISLADAHINYTLESCFWNKKILPDSIERLKLGMELLYEGIKDMENYSKLGSAQKKEADGFLSWAYGLIGKSTNPSLTDK